MKGNKLRPRPGLAARPASRREAFTVNQNEERTVAAIDDLALFEDLQKSLIPELRKAINAGKDTKDILQIGKAAALARLVSLATMNADDKTALSAVKELLDRLEGKVTEKKELTHKLAKLEESEVDALLLTSLSEVDGGDDAA